MTNLQDFFEQSRKMKFPRIIKVSSLPKKIRIDFDRGQNYREANNQVIKETDLVIVRVCTWFSDNAPASYSFEKIIVDPVSYLLKKLWDTEEESADRLDSLSCDD